MPGPVDPSRPTGDAARLPARRFDDREVGLIIQRAGELQQSSAVAAERGGMSLDELEQVAREAGLDPALVRRAARELDDAAPIAGSRLAGAPLRVLLERTFDGEISTDEYEALVGEMRRSMNTPGTVNVLGRTLSWSMGGANHRPGGGMRQLSVSVAPRHGRTTLRIEESFGNLAGGLFGGMVGGMSGLGTGLGVGVGVGVLHSAAAAAGIIGGVVLAAYGGARGIYSLLVRRRRHQLQLLFDRLSEQVERALEQ